MNNDTEWDDNKLLVKASLYGSYARDADRSSQLYGFWSSLYLELLARSALSRIHPVLLADPKDGKNILYVFGVPIQNGGPTSIPAKIAYNRCHKLIETFDDKALKHCMLMAQARNTEVHSGDSGFEAMTHNRWQSEHYRVTKTLCDFLKADIADFFDAEEAADSEKYLATSTQELAGRTKGKLNIKSEWFRSLDSTEQNERREVSVEKAREIAGSHTLHETQACPACCCSGILVGERDIGRKVKLVNDSLIEHVTVASSRFICGACRLDLNREELMAVGLLPTFSRGNLLDPVEHFGVDPREYFDIDDLEPHEIDDIARSHGYYYSEPDYGND